MSSSSQAELPVVQDLQRNCLHYLGRWGALDLGTPRVQYNPRMRSRAGVAWLDDRRIDLNPHLLDRHPDRLWETLVHELAHLVVWSRSGRAAEPHGPEWETLMAEAGFVPRRLHGMDVREVRRKRRSCYYLHLCRGCDAWWIARRLRRDRLCRSCGPDVVQVYRTERTRAGLAELRRIAEGAS